jgi:hypothetical protein
MLKARELAKEVTLLQTEEQLKERFFEELLERYETLSDSELLEEEFRIISGGA